MLMKTHQARQLSRPPRRLVKRAVTGMDGIRRMHFYLTYSLDIEDMSVALALTYYLEQQISDRPFKTLLRSVAIERINCLLVNHGSAIVSEYRFGQHAKASDAEYRFLSILSRRTVQKLFPDFFRHTPPQTPTYPSAA